MTSETLEQSVGHVDQKVVEEAYLDGLLGTGIDAAVEVTFLTQDVLSKQALSVEAVPVDVTAIKAEKSAAEKLAAEKLEATKLEAEKLAAEKLAAEKLAAEKLAAEKLAAEKLAAEKLAAEKSAAEKSAAEKSAAEKLAAEKLAAEKLEAEKLEAEKLEAEKLEAEKLEAEKLEAEKLEAEKLEAEKLAADRLLASSEDSGLDVTNSETPVDSLKDTDVYDERVVPFMCQQFTIMGLNLALPLSVFSHVIPWPETVMPVSAGADHIVGKLLYNDSHYEIVDISSLIVPTRRAEAIANKVSQNYICIVMLMDGRTGIACEACGDTVLLKPDNVCWRSETSQRLWLAGTISQGAYALLDIDGIMGLLA